MGKNASILLIQKPSGITSFIALNDIKRTVDPKVGHAGTLDKFAQGLLVVLTGSMTKLNVLFSTMDKSYRAHIQFGVETDTLDPEGEIVAQALQPSLSRIEQEIPAFLGDIEQEPPLYSALHIQGKRASDIARSGKIVAMKSRPVTVYRFEVVDYTDGLLIADIHVSKGTYIRSLARDLALSCGSRGYLKNLVRTSIGPFSLDEAVQAKDTKAVLDSMKHTEQYLKRLNTISLHEVSNHHLFSLANGTFPKKYETIRREGHEQYGAFYSRDGILRAVADMQSSRLIAQIHPYSREVES
ncbi:MAG: tRNA pseudouridine(55) synthase TruB [Spirochaetia bacterium]|nr:tRNA pseudouridine(55) synthase TruB [Spirochaetia bacterium]